MSKDTRLTVDKLLEQLQLETHYADSSVELLASQRKILLTQILQLLEDVAPEKRNGEVDPQTGAPVGMQGCVDHGYNQATQDYLAKIKELFQ